jgi:hypothetical protein
MRGWRLSGLARTALIVIVVGFAAGFLAPRPWNAIGLFLAVGFFLAAVMDGMLGGSFAGGPIPMSDEERVSLFRRLYRPKPRD